MNTRQENSRPIIATVICVVCMIAIIVLAATLIRANGTRNFVIIAAVVFFLIVRPLAKLQERQKAAVPAAAQTTKDCPFCYSSVPLKATRCPHCTSQLT